MDLNSRLAFSTILDDEKPILFPKNVKNKQVFLSFVAIVLLHMKFSYLMISLNGDMDDYLISIIKLVIMKKNGEDYDLVQTKLDSLYGNTFEDCASHPEYFRTVLKDVYHEKYDSIVQEIKTQLGDSIEYKEISEFLKIMDAKD